MRRTASPAQRNGPTTLTAVIRTIRSGGIWSTRSWWSAIPALLTSAVRRPRPSAAWNRAATSSGEATSAGTATATPPAAWHAATTCLAASGALR